MSREYHQIRPTTFQFAELTVLAQQRDHSAVIAPNHILDRRRRKLGEYLLLLNIEEDNAGRCAEQQTCCTTIEDVVRLRRTLDGFGDRVAQISNLDCLRRLVQNSESVASDKQCSGSTSTLSVIRVPDFATVLR